VQQLRAIATEVDSHFWCNLSWSDRFHLSIGLHYHCFIKCYFRKNGY